MPTTTPPFIGGGPTVSRGDTVSADPSGGDFWSSVMARGNGGILPERGSDMQRDMVMASLQSAMSSANASGSPLLSFLAPLAGGAIASRTQSLNDRSQAAAREKSITDFLSSTGGGDEDRAWLEMLADPNLPPEAKGVIKSRLTKANGTSGRARTKLSGQYKGADGLLYGRDANGNLVPYTGADGQPFQYPDGDSSLNPYEAIRIESMIREDADSLRFENNPKTGELYTPDEAYKAARERVSGEDSLIAPYMQPGVARPPVTELAKPGAAATRGSAPPPPPGTVPY